MEVARRGPGVKKKFQKTLILVFEVIMQRQTPKHTFEIGIFFRILAHCGKGSKYLHARSKRKTFLSRQYQKEKE